MFLKWRGYPVLNFHQQCMRVLIFPYLTNTFSVLSIIAILLDVKWSSPWGFTLYFLDGDHILVFCRKPFRDMHSKPLPLGISCPDSSVLPRGWRVSRGFTTVRQLPKKTLTLPRPLWQYAPRHSATGKNMRSSLGITLVPLRARTSENQTSC